MSIKERFAAVKLELGTFLFYLFVSVFILNLIFMIWIPANDYDTMSSYLARIKLEEFGPLKQTATLEIQYLFPKFFDYLHAPLLKLGLFITLPNFLLFSIVMFMIVWRFTPKVAAWSLVFLFFCPSILLTITSAKSDISLGLEAFIAWYVISYAQKSIWYCALSLALIAMLVGTKWHGIVLAGPLFLYLLWNLKKQGCNAFKKLMIAVPFIPLYFYISSFAVYWANYHDYGTLFPRPDYLERHVDILSNFKNIVPALLLDTFDPPYHWFQLLTQGIVSPAADYYFGKETRSLIYAMSDFNSQGIFLLLVLLGSALAIFKRTLSFEIKVSAALGILYFFVVTVAFPYSTWINRYYLAAYVLGIIPTASLLKNISPLRYQKILIIVFLVFCSYAIFFNGEKRLLPMKLKDNNGNVQYYPTIYRHFFNRNDLYFNVWGYDKVYWYMKENIAKDNSLTFVNFALKGDAPFLYPLIREREGRNTNIINIRNFKNSTPELNLQADYVMTFRKPIDNAKYELVFDLHNDDHCAEICIFKRK